MNQQSQILKDVMDSIHAAFTPTDNGYECCELEINCEDYVFERDGSEWWWNCYHLNGYGDSFTSFCECLQSALDFASAYKKKHTEKYNWREDIAEAQRKGN